MVELEPWYYGYIDSAMAGKMCKKDGDFVMRYSVNMQRYIITCKWNNACQHCIVDVSSMSTVVYVRIVQQGVDTLYVAK